MEARYAPGDGLLVARNGSYLLLRTRGVGWPPGLLEQLWEDLARPSVAHLVPATVRRHAPGAELVLLERTGRPVAEGSGAVEQRGDRWLLRVGPPGTSEPTLPLVEGVVAADVVEVGAPRPDTVAGTPTGLIDGIPPEILGSTPAHTARASPAQQDGEAHGGRTARRLPGAAATRPPTAPPGAGADTDHDSHTVLRSATHPPAPDGSPEHLQQSTSDTVLAARCHRGHLTDSLSDTCRTCRGPVPPQQPQRVLRPPLGVLLLPDGGRISLDRPVVLGRSPQASGDGDWPHLVRLPHDTTYLSRRHLRLDLEGWHVLAVDLGSRGGTVVTSPGRDPERIRPGEPYLLEHGATIDLADAYRATYRTTDEESE